MPKVGVALPLINVATLAAAGEGQVPVPGLVWQSDMEIGSVADPVSAVAVIVAEMPKLTVATAKAPDPDAPGISTDRSERCGPAAFRRHGGGSDTGRGRPPATADAEQRRFKRRAGS